MDRIIVDVIHQPQKVRFCLNENTFRMFLKKASSPFFLFIDCLGKTDRKPTHLLLYLPVITNLDSNQKMKVVRHEAIRPDLKQNSKVFFPFFKKIDIISFLKKKLICLAVGPIKDVIKFSCHKRNIVFHLEWRFRDTIAQFFLTGEFFTIYSLVGP